MPRGLVKVVLVGVSPHKSPSSVRSDDALVVAHRFKIFRIEFSHRVGLQKLRAFWLSLPLRDFVVANAQDVLRNVPFELPTARYSFKNTIL